MLQGRNRQYKVVNALSSIPIEVHINTLTPFIPTSSITQEWSKIKFIISKDITDDTNKYSSKNIRVKSQRLV